MRQKQRAQEIRAHIVVENDTRHADTNQRQKNQPSEIPAIAVECGTLELHSAIGRKRRHKQGKHKHKPDHAPPQPRG